MCLQIEKVLRTLRYPPALRQNLFNLKDPNVNI